MKPLKASTYLNIALSLLFLLAGLVVIVLVNIQMRQQALAEAEEKALIILQRNLAIHQYFSNELKPKLFEYTKPIRTPDYFEPVWMSSTYAIRKMDKLYQSISQSKFYYKDSAINARSPENEADSFERTFLNKLKANPAINKSSSIRIFNGEPYFVVLHRGESMEEACLRCHSTPERAPGDLVVIMDGYAVLTATRGNWSQ